MRLNAGSKRRKNEKLPNSCYQVVQLKCRNHSSNYSHSPSYLERKFPTSSKAVTCCSLVYWMRDNKNKSCFWTGPPTTQLFQAPGTQTAENVWKYPNILTLSYQTVAALRALCPNQNLPAVFEVRPYMTSTGSPTVYIWYKYNADVMLSRLMQKHVLSLFLNYSSIRILDREQEYLVIFLSGRLSQLHPIHSFFCCLVLLNRTF